MWGSETVGQRKLLATAFLSCLLLIYLCACDRQSFPLQNCEPTPYDEVGPFYRPGAPVRDTVGTGYVLTGQVLSVSGCKPLSDCRMEFWLVNPEGDYDSAHRATIFADSKGYYRFESNLPIGYAGRLPHIHMMVTAKGHEQLTTQHYPQEGRSKAAFNLVLKPLP